MMLRTNSLAFLLSTVLLLVFLIAPLYMLASDDAMADEKARRIQYGPDNPAETYVPHAYKEYQADIGEISMNYAVVGSPENPAIVLLPAQGESWWGYEKAMDILSKNFQVYAVDLRGQGRSSRTPGRYTIDNFGNDVVRFITYVVRRPVIVSGLSSGGVITAWVSAYAPPGMIRGAVYEDPPLFSSELTPAIGVSIKQHVVYDYFKLLNQYLGDQWKTGDYAGFVQAAHEKFPFVLKNSDEPGQSTKEYDPEWARAFFSGTASASCDHAQMLSQVKCPVLFTHHTRSPEPAAIGETLKGALSDKQVKVVGDLITEAGQPFTYKSFPKMGHFMHTKDPELFTNLIKEWAKSLPSETEVRSQGVFADD